MKCPHCGEKIPKYKNPVPTVDIIIELDDRPGEVVLILRKNPPYGWAIPGGFVDEGESLESAAVREALEETGLEVRELTQFHTYSNPARDPRQHTITTVYTAKADGTPNANDDAKDICVFHIDSLPEQMAFDHREVLRDCYATRCKR